jgi:Zn-dependent protease with chaperone function
MTDAVALRRRELALAALGLTIVLIALLVAVDAVRDHGGMVLMLVLAVDTLAGGLGMRSVVREVRRQRAFRRRLPVGAVRTIAGTRVHVVPDRDPHAFCAGLLRPRIFVSSGALERLAPPSLHAVVAHEAEHAARRDPLRLLLARAVAAAVPGVPALRRLAARQAAVAELAADAAAVRALGSRQPLASALVVFGQSGGVDRERVDHLAGRPCGGVSAPVLATAGAALAGVLVVSAFTPLCTFAVLPPAFAATVLASRRA